MSREVTQHIGPAGLKITGVSFDLHSFHPDLLYVAAVDLTASEILELRQRRPGVGVDEGHLYFVPAEFRNADTQRALREGNWNPGGKASLVRALEIIDHLQRYEDLTHEKAVDWLRTTR